MGKYDIRQHRDVIIGCSVAGIAALVTLTVCLYRCRQRSRQPSVVDPEFGDGPSLEHGRLVAVQAPPPVPDLCPYSPQLGELASVGQSPTEQYASECRAVRETGAGGPRAFDVGGPGNKRRATEEIDVEPGGTTSENSQAVTRHLRPIVYRSPKLQNPEMREISQAGALADSETGNLSPSKLHDAKVLTTNVEEDGDKDDDGDDDDDDDDVDMMKISETNNNDSNISSTNHSNNNNNNGDEEEHVASSSEEGFQTTSTNNTESR